MSEFRKAFETYGGDYDATMVRFLGREALYLKMLNMLPGDDSLQKLGDALDSGNLECAFEAAHTLKGVVGNLGLTPFYQAICVITEPLRAGENRDDYQALYQTVQAEYRKVEALMGEQGGGNPE